MWIGIIIAAVVIGALIGLFSSRDSHEAAGNALGGAAMGGCMAAGCLFRLFVAGVIILLILWLFFKLFG